MTMFSPDTPELRKTSAELARIARAKTLTLELSFLLTDLGYRQMPRTLLGSNFQRLAAKERKLRRRARAAAERAEAAR